MATSPWEAPITHLLIRQVVKDLIFRVPVAGSLRCSRVKRSLQSSQAPWNAASTADIPSGSSAAAKTLAIAAAGRLPGSASVHLTILAPISHRDDGLLGRSATPDCTTRTP